MRIYSFLTKQCFAKVLNPILHFIILIFGFTLSAQIPSDSPKEIILLIGQSNMSGRANLQDQDYKKTIERFANISCYITMLKSTVANLKMN